MFAGTFFLVADYKPRPGDNPEVSSYGWAGCQRSAVVICRPSRAIDCKQGPTDCHTTHDGVMSWKHFLHYWAPYEGKPPGDRHRSPGGFPSQGALVSLTEALQWRALLFPVCNGSLNKLLNKESVQLKGYDAHMTPLWCIIGLIQYSIRCYNDVLCNRTKPW